MVYPEALDERPIEHRREIQLKLEISVFAEPSDVDSPEYCIGVPHTKSVKKSGSRGGRTVLDLRLEVLGATTGKPLMSACHACSVRECSPSANVSMVDFVAKEDLINVKQGKAHIAFRFLCLLDTTGLWTRNTSEPLLLFQAHHSRTYRLSAMVLERNQVLERHTFPNWLKVVSRSHKRKGARPTTIPQGIEAPRVMELPFNSAVSQGMPLLRVYATLRGLL